MTGFQHVEIGQLQGERQRKRYKNSEGVPIADDMRQMNLRKADAQEECGRGRYILGNRPIRASAETRTLKL